MKTKKTFRNLFSLIMVFAMLFTCGGFAAFAEITTPVEVEALDAATDIEVEKNDDIHISNAGDVEAAVSVKAYEGGEAEFEGHGEITAESANGDATALNIDVWKGGEAEIDAQGDIEASAPNGEAVGIKAEAMAGGASGDVDVTGDVSAEGDQAVGIEDTIDNNASLDITVDGNVKAVGESSAVGVDLPVIAGGPNPGPSKTEVHVTGEVSAESNGSATGVEIVSDNQTEAKVTIDKSVSAVGANNVKGVFVSAEVGSADITVGGNVEAKSDNNGYDVIGVKTITNEEGKIKTEINGKVEVEKDATGWATGVNAISYGESETDIEVKGPVTVTGETYAAGVSLEIIDGNATAKVGAVTVTSEAYYGASAINVEMHDGTANVEVNGDVKSNGFGINVSMEDQGTGTTEVIVNGDVDAGIYGLKAITNGDSGVVSDILVDGTLHGDEHAIVVNEATTEENLKITVYKIDLDEDGDAVKSSIPFKGVSATANSREIEESIMYIIRVDQPEEGATLKAVKEDGSDLEQSHGHDVAKEGETVLMKVDLAPGYKVTGAFSVDGEELNIYEKDGQYYVEVPKGGGVWLSARVEKLPDDDGDWYPGAKQTNYVDVTFEFNGGHRKESPFTGPVVKRVPVGTYVVLIDAPVREDAEFIEWVSDSEAVMVSKPGQNFRAMESVVFTASWSDDPAPAASERSEAQTIVPKENVTLVSTTDEQMPAADVSDAEVSAETTSPVTGDSSAAAATLTLDGSAAAITLGGNEAAAISLADLLNGDGSGLSAKLVVDLGNGNSLEIPVNIQLSFGEAQIVTT